MNIEAAGDPRLSDQLPPKALTRSRMPISPIAGTGGRASTSPGFSTRTVKAVGVRRTTTDAVETP